MVFFPKLKKEIENLEKKKDMKQCRNKRRGLGSNCGPLVVSRSGDTLIYDSKVTKRYRRKVMGIWRENTDWEDDDDEVGS